MKDLRKKFIKKRVLSFKFDFKKNALRFSVLVSFCFVFLGIIYFLLNYKIDKYKLNNLKYVNVEEISSILEEEMNKNNFISLNTQQIEKKIKSSSVYIKKVTVSKSLFHGVIINIIEFEPQVIIKTIDNKRYFISRDERIIEIDSSSNAVKDLAELYYTGANINDFNFLKYALSAKYVVEKLDNKVYGNFNFDNFGNFFILLEGNRVIRYDLNESFFSLDDQIELMNEAIRQNPSFKEINLQFSYLVIK